MNVFFTKEQENQYVTIPFDVPADTERVDVQCRYAIGDGGVIDLALLGPDGALLGAAGSNRAKVWVSALGSSQGFETLDPPKGRWHILAGVYKLPQEGLQVEYTITLAPKSRRLFKGDTHLHTLASDGMSDITHIIDLAKDLALDFIFLTEHNNTAQNKRAGAFENITVIPGVEWTHFKGHGLFLGAERPFLGSFGASDVNESKNLVQQAKNAGAFTVIAHPMCPVVPWEWGLDEAFFMGFDGLEVWNGIMSERNERALAFWHNLLCQGKKIPATGGSDYHGPGLLGSLAMPCCCVYAPSRSPGDILAGIRSGHSFISYLPNGPAVDILAQGVGVLGEAVPLGTVLDINFSNLSSEDEILIITDAGIKKMPGSSSGCVTLERSYTDCKFMRVEVMRSYYRGLPPMKALLSNPVYFTD